MCEGLTLYKVAGGFLRGQQIFFMIIYLKDWALPFQDGSTMMIESSKGGHTAVVALLLDYPNNMLTSPPPPDLSQLTPPNLEGAEAPRVPLHGLPALPGQELLDTNVLNTSQFTNLQGGTMPRVPQGQVSSAPLIVH